MGEPQGKSATDDAALVAAVANGDRGAYRELLRRHAVGIQRYAGRLVRDPVEAEDVTQETFLRLWLRAGDYDPVARVTTWLFRIAHNLCVDRLRARGRVELLEEPDAERASESGAQPALLESKQRAEALSSALDALLEAAEVLAVSEEALESLLSRGRRGLKARLLGSRADVSGEFS
jgi:RNA polymerase sigma-70 factor (ECF subfamily)